MAKDSIQEASCRVPCQTLNRHYAAQAQQVWQPGLQSGRTLRQVVHRVRACAVLTWCSSALTEGNRRRPSGSHTEHASPVMPCTWLKLHQHAAPYIES